LAGKGQHLARSWGDKEHIRQVVEAFINVDPDKNVEVALDWLRNYHKEITIIIVRLTSGCSCETASALRGMSFDNCQRQVGMLGQVDWGGGCCVCTMKVGGDGVETAVFAKCGPIKPTEPTERVLMEDVGGENAVDEEEIEKHNMRYLLSEVDMQCIMGIEDPEYLPEEDPEYIHEEEELPPSTRIVISSSNPDKVGKKKKQQFLLKDNKPTYSTQQRPRFHRLQPKTKTDKKYKQKLLGGPPPKRKLKKTKTKTQMKVSHKQQTLDECGAVGR